MREPGAGHGSVSVHCEMQTDPSDGALVGSPWNSEAMESVEKQVGTQSHRQPFLYPAEKLLEPGFHPEPC